MVTYQSFIGGMTKTCLATAFEHIKNDKEVVPNPLMLNDMMQFTCYPLLSYGVRNQ